MPGRSGAADLWRFSSDVRACPLVFIEVFIAPVILWGTSFLIITEIILGLLDHPHLYFQTRSRPSTSLSIE